MDSQESQIEAKSGGSRRPKLPWAALALIGFTSIIAQIVLMRELIVVFSGNEISLGIILATWLFWTALGSGLLGCLASRASNPRRLMAGLQGLIGVVLPATILAVRASKAVIPHTPGEILGPEHVFLTSLAVLSIFCLVSGLLFAVGSQVYVRETRGSTVDATSSVYLLEAAGSGAGGLLASLVLIRYFSALEIALVLSFLNFLAMVGLTFQRPRWRIAAYGAVLSLFVLLIFPYVHPRLDRMSLAWLWKGFNVVAARNSIYGNLAVVQTESTRTLFENGLVVFSVPDPAAAEEAVQFALLQHPSPNSLLLIGGGMNGSLAQALQHATLERVDYVELDPTILDLAQYHFPTEWAPIRSDSRVRTHPMDGRLFLKTTTDDFDVIILNLPDPQTAQLNRFYTVEFFREVAARLAPAGVFSFQIRGAEDYISPELADFLRCLRKTLGEVFPEVTYIPGGTAHFFATTHPGILATGPHDLVARLQARHLQTQYVREYYIPSRMMPDRMLDFETQTRPRAGTPVNRDFAPIAYYFDVLLWGKRFNPGYHEVFQSIASAQFHWLAAAAGILIFGLAGTVWWFRGQDARLRYTAGLCVAATGFTLIGLEILLLLAFQAIFGYVYHELAILIAAFMVGMALGSWRALRRPPDVGQSQNRRRNTLALAWLQILVAISPVILYAMFSEFTTIKNPLGIFVVSQLVFPSLALLCGLLGGYQFPVASRVFFLDADRVKGSPGTLYALDLLGACLGAVALSVYFIPVFGFLTTGLFISGANLVPAGLGFLALFQARNHPD